MQKEVQKALFTILTVPLGGQSTEEYVEMKKAVCSALEVLVKAGKFENEMTATLSQLEMLLSSEQFKDFLKNFALKGD